MKTTYMNRQALIHCFKRIQPYIHHTPVLTSRLLNEIAGASLFFKCENFQRMGAFKMRGAVHAILQLSDEQRAHGVVTHSSGNFAQALSLAAQTLGVTAYIVMPATAPMVKKAAVQDYGGIIIECPPTLTDREATAARIQAEKQATFIHPSDDPDVILGQGTAAMELLETHADLDVIFCSVGGGGLIGGTALAATHFGNHCAVIGGEPLAVDDAYRSLRSGRIESNTTTDTIADGLKTQLGKHTFPIIQQQVAEIIRVEEDEIVAAMQLVWERLKIIIESSAAVAFAAMLKEKHRFTNQKIGIILSGGNVDLSQLPFSRS